MDRLSALASSLNINRSTFDTAVSFVKDAAMFNLAGGIDDNLALTKITPQIYAMGLPGEIPSETGILLPVLSQFLHANFPGRFMILNLSDKTYNYSTLDNQVVEFKFPGHPAPPLDKILSICHSIDGWVRADEGNVAVIHCQTGRGRTAVAIACYLSWTGMHSSPMDAISQFADASQVDAKRILIPSQIRYLQYFARILQGEFPVKARVRLNRIVMTSIPSMNDKIGFRPFIQIFKYAMLLHTTCPKNTSDLATFDSSEKNAKFEICKIIEGDILVVIRHLSSENSRVSVIRMAFHTGYIGSSGQLHLSKGDIDGACMDPRFPDDFSLDLYFELLPEEPNEVVAQMEYWKQMSYREPQTPKSKANPIPKFNLLHDEEPADLKKYVSGRDLIGTPADTYDPNDTDVLLADLQMEISGADDERKTSQEEDNPSVMSDTELDDEINRLLAES